MKTWIDIFNGPHVHFFENADEFLGPVLMTARKYKPIQELIELYGIEATLIGRHGGKNPYQKLIASTDRVLLLSRFIRRKRLTLAVHKHSVEAARVAWGLQIPSISFIDNELMVPQNMLVCPLSQVLIAPIAIPQPVLRAFTPAHVNILQFDGVSEVANVHRHMPDESVLNELGLQSNRPIIVLRGEPVLASYARRNGLESAIVSSIKRSIPDAQLVRLGRDGEDSRYLLPVFDARSLFSFADLVISGGGTMAREACLLGAKAITYFDQPLAVDGYLVRKRLLKSMPGREILNADWRAEISRRPHRIASDSFEHPFSLLEKAGRLIQMRNDRVVKDRMLPS